VEIVKEVRQKAKTWIFILAGQSNMAGRALVEPEDTLAHQRILSIDKERQHIYAKEPLHFYEPSMAGLDCGVSFARTLIEDIPDSISILLIPTAVGGSSISQWLGDSLHRNVKLLSNFKDHINTAKNHGEIKGILWHQGESDAHPGGIPEYHLRLSELFKIFRTTAENEKLPIIIGELGSYSRDAENWKMINSKILDYSRSDPNSFIVSTSDFTHNGDGVHFNSTGQRLMGQRMAREFVKTLK